jgi:hypothetical protein
MQIQTVFESINMQGRMFGDVLKNFLLFELDERQTRTRKKTLPTWELNWFTLGPVKLITLTK